MQFSNARVARSGQMRKDVPFPLRNPEAIQKDANAVRGAMDFRNQAKRLSRHDDRVKLCVLDRFAARVSTCRSRDSLRAADYCRSRVTALKGWLRRIAALFVSQAGDRRSFACAPADRNRRKSFPFFVLIRRAYFVHKR